MNLLHKSVLSSIFVLTPLSAAMAVDVLPTINVTANRVAVEDKNTMAGVTIIDREEIERKQFHSLEDLLKTLPSVTYKSNGGRGQPSSISIRGSNSNAVLVLVDGQRLGSVTTGQTAFEHLPIDQIERVEVVRGPRSSLYGSDAIAGVIQIFTRKATQDGVKPFVTLGYGSHETYEGTAGVNLRQGDTWGTLSVTGTKTDGIDATSTLIEPDRDGYRNFSALLNAGHQFNDQLSVDMNALHVEGKTYYDNSYAVDPYNRVRQEVYGLGLSYSPFDMWNTKFKVGRSEDKYEIFSDKKSTLNYTSIKETASWLNTVEFDKNNTLLLGVDYLNDKLDASDAVLDGKSRDNFGYYAQYLANVGQFDLQAALRLDDNQQFGTHTTGNVSLGYQFNDQIMAYMSYGTAFKAPTFNDLYSPYGGNEQLVPEESKNYELGLKGQVVDINWELIGFYNEIEDLIVWRPTAPGSWDWYASQVDKARIRGVELNLGQNLDNWQWNASYTYQDPENRSSDKSRGKQINYRAKQILNLSADYKMQEWTVGGAVHAEDKRYVDEENLNTAYLPSFATADVRVAYQVNPDFSIQAKLANMFDKQYETSQGYNQDGRTAWLTLRYAMK